MKIKLLFLNFSIFLCYTATTFAEGVFMNHPISCYNFTENIIYGVENKSCTGNMKCSMSIIKKGKDLFNLEAILVQLKYLQDYEPNFKYGEDIFARFSSESSDALQELQKDEGLPETGNLDNTTRKHLNSQFSCLPQPKFTKKPVKEFTFDGKTWIRTGVKYIKPSFTSDSISTVVYTLKNEKKLNLSELTQNISISKNYTSNNFIKKETSISIWYQNTQKMLDQNSDTHSLIYPIENFSNQYGEGFSFGYVENSNPFVPRYKYQIKIGEDYYTFEFSEISEESKDNAYKFVKELKKAKEVEGDNLKVEDVIARFQTLVDQNLALAKQNSEKTKQMLLRLILVSPKDQHNFKKSEIGIDLRN